MKDELIQCPKDPNIEYLKKVCENIFRKDSFRTWCKECANFPSAAATSKNK